MTRMSKEWEEATLRAETGCTASLVCVRKLNANLGVIRGRSEGGLALRLNVEHVERLIMNECSGRTCRCRMAVDGKCNRPPSLLTPWAALPVSFSVSFG